jgi:hypothetical protein
MLGPMVSPAEACDRLGPARRRLTGCSIAGFHRDPLDELPSWRPLADETLG